MDPVPVSYELHNNNEHMLKAVLKTDSGNLTVIFNFVSPREIQVYKVAEVGAEKLPVAINSITMRVSDGDGQEIMEWQKRLSEKGGKPVGGFWFP